jgi:transcriptional regulator with XRE-family HTH domain
MANKTASLLPPTTRLLEDMGERLRMARLRRRLQAKQVAERAGMSVMTLRAIERGSPGVTIGAYIAVMQVLQIEQDIAEVAKADVMGRRLQDATLVKSMKPRRAISPASIKSRDKPSLAESSIELTEDKSASGGISSKQLLLLLNRPNVKR